MNKKFYPLLIILMLVSVVVFYTDTELQPVVASQDEQWHLPVAHYSKPDQSVQKKLKNINLWQDKTVETISDLKNWALKGIVYQHEIPYILVLVQGQPKLLKYNLNAILPNGEILLEIKADEIVIEDHGKRKVARLFGNS